MYSQFYEELSALCAQTQLYLMENYSKGERLSVAHENQSLFRKAPLPPAAPSSIPNKTALPPAQTPAKQTAPPPPRPVAKREAIPFPQIEKKPLPAAPKEALKSATEPLMLSDDPLEQSKPNDEILRAIGEMFPHIKILPPPQPTPPPAVALLSLGEPPLELEFLHHIAAALSICFGVSCRVVNPRLEKLDSRSTKLLLASEHRLNDSLSQSAIPLVAMPDLSLCMQNASLKASLWITIANHIVKHVR